MQYRIDFFHDLKDKEFYALMKVWEVEKCAWVALTIEISKNAAKVDEGPEAHAKHEAIHLLLHRLSWLGGCWYITDVDLAEECEAIVVRLEKVLE